MKRIFSIVLSIVLALTIIPFYAGAESSSEIKVGDSIEFGSYYQTSDGNGGFNKEPIKWNVLKIENGKALLLSSKIIDAARYNNTSATVNGYYGNNYAHSEVRKWLIDDFYNSAFTENEKNCILETTLDNSACATDYNASGSYNKYSSESTTDKVFLLSKNEIDILASKYMNKSVTDYAKSRGFQQIVSTEACNAWLTRTAGNNTFQIYYVQIRWGKWTTYYNWNDDKITVKMGVCPAIWVDIEKINQSNDGLVKGSYTWLSDNQIRIDSTWYDIDKNVDGLKSYIGKLSLFTKVSCYVKDGVVVACSTADNPVSPFFSVTPSDKNIKFDVNSASFSKENIQLSVDITNGMKEKGVGWETLDAMSFAFDSFSIYVDEPMYFKHGLFGLSKTNSYTVKLDHPVTIYPGYSYNIDEEINVFFDSDKMSETVKDVYGNAEANISLSVSNSGNSVGSARNFVTITDKQIQNSGVNTSALDSSYKSAGSQLNSGISSIKLENDFLREIFSENDWNAIKTDIVCKAILKEIPKSSYEKNTDISKKAFNKLIGKIGVNTSIIPTMRTETITTRAFVSSEKYGDMEVDISVKMNYPAVGNDGAFAAYSLETADYKIKGSKKIPADKRSGTCTCMIALADISQFASSVERVSMSEIENAYNMCYGNDLNQFCDMFFGNVVTKIISKTKFKSYSHSLFKLLSYPSTAVSIYCPVDVYVYNDSGELCASVVDNEAECSDENIMIDVNGDEKTVKVYGDDYSIKLVGTAYSAMDVEVVNNASYNDTLRTVRYNNVELEPGKVFSLDVKDDDYSSNNYDITVNENETIKPDSDSFSVHRASPGDWEVQRDATCTKTGQSVKKCTVCGEIVETKETSALGHVDDNGDKICDRCGDDITDIQKNCKHICHSTNRFLKFIWKIVNFIHRIFGINKHCSCGLKHY